MRVGFIGLGNMGSAMARNLLKRGHELIIYNRTRSRADSLEELGARIAVSPGEAASSGEVIVTMLADDQALEFVAFGENGILASLASGAVHIGMSTTSVALSRRLTLEHCQRQQYYVSAPVFGRPEAAAAAKLFVVAAGKSAQIDRCQSIFDAIGQKTFIASDQPAAANVVKLAGNFLISTVIESLAEALTLGRKSGVDPKTFVDILTDSLFGASVYRTYGSMIAEDKFEPVGFKMQLGFKDNQLVLKAAEKAGVPMPIANLIHDRFVTAVAQGLGEADWSAFARIVSQSAGV